MRTLLRGAAGACWGLWAGPLVAQAPGESPALAPPPSVLRTQTAPATAAVIAVLDKRTLDVVDLSVQPGQTFRAGRLSGVLRTCRQTLPPARRETAAFLELWVASTRRDGEAARPRKVFSGWMFVESPSLNPLVHPAYDVWVRNCTIALPEIAVVSGPAGRRVSKAVQQAGVASASSSRAR